MLFLTIANSHKNCRGQAPSLPHRTQIRSPIPLVEIGVVAQLRWRSEWWVCRSARLAVLGLWFDVVVVVDEIDNGGCFLWLLVIFGIFFSLGDFCGGCFLWWLLLVVGLVVF